MGLDRVGAGTRAERFLLQTDILPILPIFLDGGHLFRIFVAGDGLVVDAGRPGMFNPLNDTAMVKAKIGKHEVEIYDTIEELPMVRFHKYQKLLLIDAGIGSDITAFDQRGEKIERWGGSAGSWGAGYDRLYIPVEPGDTYVTLSYDRFGESVTLKVPLPEVTP